MQTTSPKITPFLWFDSQDEEAASFYTSIFKNSRIVSITRYGGEGATGRRKTQGNGNDRGIPCSSRLADGRRVW